MPNAKPPATETTAGILLAGGRSRRMGGGDKPFVCVGGISLLARAIAALRPQCDAMLICAGGNPARFSSYGLPVVGDAVPDFAGPLSGILAGLDFIADYLPEVRFAVSIATDTPFFPADLVARLHRARLDQGADIACARSGEQTHFVIALWPVSIRADLRHALIDEDLHKIETFQERYSVAYAVWPTTPFDPFLNVNDANDLAAAEKLVDEGVVR